MLEWLAAVAVLGLFLVLLPRMLRRTKATRPKGGGSGVWVGIGLVVAMIFDPKTTQTTELIARKQDEREDEESGEKP